MIEETLKNAISANWPMFLIFTTVIVTIRIIYLIVHRDKFVLYKELFMLAFLIYAMLLFYVVTFQDVNYGTNNFIPFKEIFRYEIGSKVFVKNILGNIILFIPFGIFVSYILETRRPMFIVIISLITSGVIEYTQLRIGRTFDIDDIILNVVGGFVGYLVYLIIDVVSDHLPSFFRTDAFKNIVVIVIIVVLVIIYTNSSLWGILR